MPITRSYCTSHNVRQDLDADNPSRLDALIALCVAAMETGDYDALCAAYDALDAFCHDTTARRYLREDARSWREAVHDELIVA